MKKNYFILLFIFVIGMFIIPFNVSAQTLTCNYPSKLITYDDTVSDYFSMFKNGQELSVTCVIDTDKIDTSKKNNSKNNDAIKCTKTFGNGHDTPENSVFPITNWYVNWDISYESMPKSNNSPWASQVKDSGKCPDYLVGVLSAGEYSVGAAHFFHSIDEIKYYLQDGILNRNQVFSSGIDGKDSEELNSIDEEINKTDAEDGEVPFEEDSQKIPNTEYDKNGNYTTCSSLFGSIEDDTSMAWLINKFFGYFKILAPIIVLLMSSVDFIKAMIANDDDTMKKAQKKLITRIIIAIALFLVPTLTMLLLRLFGLVDDMSCIS